LASGSVQLTRRGCTHPVAFASGAMYAKNSAKRPKMINVSLASLDASNDSDSDMTPRFHTENSLRLPGVTARSDKPMLTVDAFQAALAATVDLDLLATFREVLNARVKELELELQEKCMDATPSSQASDSTEAPVSPLNSIPFVDDGDKPPRSALKIADWSLGRQLGSGRFATVFCARNQASACNVAAKVISKDEVDVADDWENVASEYEVLRSLGPHPNIVCLKGAVQSPKRIYFFMDLANGKDLFDFIKIRQQSRKPVPMEAIRVISGCIASALAHCHEHGTCHRDLKPENIIVQQDYTAKLVDFGCACPRHALQGQNVGTMPFIAPECVRGVATDGAPADVWSLGVVVLEMKFGLRTLSRFLSSWSDASTGACGELLANLFADPVQAVAQMRSQSETTADVEGDDVLATMLHADPRQRPLAAALPIELADPQQRPRSCTI